MQAKSYYIILSGNIWRINNFLASALCFFLYLGLNPSNAQDFRGMMDSSKYYQEKGDFETSLIWAKKAEIITKDSFGEKNSNYLAAISAIPDLFYYNGQLDSAIFYQENTLAYCQKYFTGNNPILSYKINTLAGFYYKYSNYRKADSLYKIALQMRRKLYKENNIELATTINDYAILQKKVGNYSEAEQLFTESLDMFRELLGNNHLFIATSLNNLACLYELTGNSKLAEFLYNEAIRIQKNINKEDNLDLAIWMNNIAEFYEKNKNHSKAEKFYKEALELMRRLFKDDHPDLALIINNLATFYSDMGRLKIAENYLQEALAMKRRLFKGDHPDLANTISQLAVLYYQLNNYSDAEKYYLEALEIRKRIYQGNNVDIATSLNHLGTLYYHLSDYTQSEKFLKESLKMRQTLFKKDHPDLINSFNSLAMVYNDIGYYTEAEKLYREALGMSRRICRNDDPSLAASLNNMASFYENMGDFRSSEPLYKESLEIYRRLYKTDHPDLATCINNVAVFYNFRGNYQIADSLYREALGMRQRLFRSDHPDLALSTLNLAIFYDKNKKYSSAEQLYLTALEMYRRIFGKDNPDLAYCLYSLATFYSDRGNDSAAKPLFIEALEMRRKILHKYNPHLATSLNSLAQLYVRSSQNQRADSLYYELFSVLEKIIENYFASFSEIEKENFLSSFKSYFEEYLSYPCFLLNNNKNILNIVNPGKQITQVYDNLLFTKSILLRTFTKARAQIINSGDSALISKFNRLRDKREYIAKLYGLTIKELEDLNINFDSVLKAANEIEKELIRESEAFAKGSIKRIYRLQDVKKSLTTDEAAIEIVRFNYFNLEKGIMTDTICYAAIIVKNRLKSSFKKGEYSDNSVSEPDDENVSLVLLDNGNDLEEKFYKDYLKAVTLTDEIKNDEKKFRNYKNEYKKYLRNSYFHYWSKIQEKLEGINKVYLSVDGIYNKINLNTLLTETGEYLIEKLDIQLVTSTRDIIETSIADESNNLAVLFGRPDFNIDFNKVHKPGTNTYRLNNFIVERGAGLKGHKPFNDLPYSEKEIRAIDRLFRTSKIRTKTFIKGSASEDAIKMLESPKILHIATHGFFEEDARKSVIVEENEQNILNNPLLHSGLVFAGANNTLKPKNKKKSSSSQTREDGILTAYEVMNLNLDNTDLVVLSACETGLGEIKNGEGVYGLQRAFKAAGTRNLLMTLWNVNDEASQKLMISFYKKYLKSMNIHTSLRDAQKEMIRSEIYSEPRLWGGFVHVGKQY